MTILVAIETVVLVLLVVVVTGLLRSHAAILRQLEELGAGVGDPDRQPAGPITSPVEFKVRPGIPEPRDDPSWADAADLTGAGLRDDVVAVRVVGAEHSTMLAFLSSSCATCATFWDAFRNVNNLTMPGGTRLVIVTKGPNDESPSEIASLAPPGVNLVMSSEAWVDYKVPGSPYFVFVDGPTGRIRGEGTGMSWEQVGNLLAQATGDMSFALGDAGRRLPNKPESDADRELRIDQELMAAGIFPGDPSLYETASGAPTGPPEATDE
jgi:hypothetical protein